ncbi:hypothetical protein BDZ97DRAFT_1915197 [Flammula alnicola]|nr:hypothetical protein BDZ97DRAFT_1915197 [Flammula alnicola]
MSVGPPSYKQDLSASNIPNALDTLLKATMSTSIPLGLQTSTNDFLNKLLHVEKSKVEKIFDACKKDKQLWDKEKEWIGLRLPNVANPKEKDLYEPFACVANAITRAPRATSRESDFIPIWVDRSNDGPKSQETHTARIRPDGLGLLGTKEDSDEWEKVVKQEEEEAEREAAEDAMEVREGEKKKKKKISQSLMAWWLRVHVLVEFKLKSDEGPLEELEQVVGYMRMVLHSQPNRRFVFGLLIRGEELHIFLGDRTGLLCTDKAINIHKDPRSFIQVIAAFCLLPLERLGYYDPTMKVWVKGKEPLQVWDTNLHLRDFQQSKYDTHWQYWRPSIIPSEGALYESLHKALKKEEALKKKEADIPGVAGQYYSSEDVKAETSGEASADTAKKPSDPTQSTDLSADVSTKDDSKKRNFEEVEKAESLAFIHFEGLLTALFNTEPPQYRTQHRVLLKQYGWSIKYAASLEEFVRIIKESVIKHRDMYMQGVLHRDISQGNILICPMESNFKDTKGALIDFDNAKRFDSFTPATLFHPLSASSESAQKALENAVGKDVIEHLTRLVADGIIKAPGEFVFSMATVLGDISGDDLGFHTKKKRGYQTSRIDKRSSSVAEATLPFASPEVLQPHIYIFRKSHTSQEAISIAHDAIHDLESFIWVMTEPGLSRQGPGGERRDELNPDRPEFQYTNTMRLRTVYHFLFGSTSPGILAENKRTMLNSDSDYEKFALAQFHPFFDQLKPYLKRLFLLVQLAHEYQLDDAYTPFLRILEEAEKELQSKPVTSKTDAEFTRRNADLETLQGFKEDGYEAVDHDDLPSLDRLGFNDEEYAIMEAQGQTTSKYSELPKPKPKLPEPVSPSPASKKPKRGP